MRLRWYTKAVNGKRMETSVSDVDTAGEVALGVQNLLTHPDVTRIEITTKDYVADPKPSTKATAITWKQTEHSKGEYWVGTIGSRMVADVFGPHSGTKPHYTLRLGDSDEWGETTTVESAKRAAQRALNKAVQALLGES